MHYALFLCLIFLTAFQLIDVCSGVVSHSCWERRRNEDRDWWEIRSRKSVTPFCGLVFLFGFDDAERVSISNKRKRLSMKGLPHLTSKCREGEWNYCICVLTRLLREKWMMFVHTESVHTEQRGKRCVIRFQEQGFDSHFHCALTSLFPVIVFLFSSFSRWFLLSSSTVLFFLSSCTSLCPQRRRKTRTLSLDLFFSGRLLILLSFRFLYGVPFVFLSPGVNFFSLLVEHVFFFSSSSSSLCARLTSSCPLIWRMLLLLTFDSSSLSRSASWSEDNDEIGRRNSL